MQRAVTNWRRTAVVAVVLGTGACSGTPAPQYVVTGNGGLTGILFLDRDQNGKFDPSAGDSALANVHLLVYERGTTSTLAGGDTHTDANGRFTLLDLPPGTHALQVDTAGLGSAIAFCNNPLPVSIYREETSFVTVDARGGCVISVADAEALSLGSRITIRGTVTSSLAQISTGEAYVEDETGGLQVFSPAGPTFAIGDVVEISGTLATFSNELELSPATVNSVTPGTPLAPATVTTAQVGASGGDVHANLQGRLVRVVAGKLIDAFTTGAGRNAQIDDGSGPVTVRFDSHVVTDTTVLKTTFTAGKCYNWTAILKAFTSPPVELFPRSLSDVLEVACP